MQMGTSGAFLLASKKRRLSASATFKETRHLINPSLIAFFMSDPMISEFITYLYHCLPSIECLSLHQAFRCLYTRGILACSVHDSSFPASGSRCLGNSCTRGYGSKNTLSYSLLDSSALGQFLLFVFPCSYPIYYFISKHCNLFYFLTYCHSEVILCQGTWAFVPVRKQTDDITPFQLHNVKKKYLFIEVRATCLCVVLCHDAKPALSRIKHFISFCFQPRFCLCKFLASCIAKNIFTYLSCDIYFLYPSFLTHTLFTQLLIAH
nr:MAG TPA: hypothetical protein [Caudoviricetes sp.]